MFGGLADEMDAIHHYPPASLGKIVRYDRLCSSMVAADQEDGCQHEQRARRSVAVWSYPHTELEDHDDEHHNQHDQQRAAAGREDYRSATALKFL